MTRTTIISLGLILFLYGGVPFAQETTVDESLLKKCKTKTITWGFYRGEKYERCKLKKPATVLGYPCKGVITFFDTGSIHSLDLAEPATVEGYPCKGEVSYHKNGKLETIQLTEAMEIAGVNVPTRSFVRFDSEGRLNRLVLSEDTEIQGYLCEGGQLFWGGKHTGFHENGTLSLCWVAQDTVVQGIPCSTGNNRCLSFYDNGNLRYCILSEEFELDGKVFKEKTCLFLDEEGNYEKHTKFGLIKGCRD